MSYPSISSPLPFLVPTLAMLAFAGGGSRAALATAAPDTSTAADTIVDGFHGYEFGVPASRIGEIDATFPPEYEVDGLQVYARTLRFIGMPSRTYFYLDPDTKRLRRGKHLIEPDSSACVRQLTTLRLMVAGTHPDLEVEVIRGSSAGADTSEAGSGGTPPVRCPGFMEADSARSWSVLFRNPTSGNVEARMELFRRSGTPRILGCYLNESDCAWPDSVEVRPGPKLRAPGRGPDTTSSGPADERPEALNREGEEGSRCGTRSPRATVIS